MRRPIRGSGPRLTLQERLGRKFGKPSFASVFEKLYVVIGAAFLADMAIERLTTGDPSEADLPALSRLATDGVIPRRRWGDLALAGHRTAALNPLERVTAYQRELRALRLIRGLRRGPRRAMLTPGARLEAREATARALRALRAIATDAQRRAIRHAWRGQTLTGADRNALYHLRRQSGSGQILDSLRAI